MGDDEIAAGTVTIKDLDLGRELARTVQDNQAWREDRPGQVVVPRTELVAAVRQIVDRGAASR
jgi:histidyl-tRNA synthetase